jgi:dipeptidyl aminopeptidase/acylaminoacyl peptidase
MKKAIFILIILGLAGFSVFWFINNRPEEIKVADLGEEQVKNLTNKDIGGGGMIEEPIIEEEITHPMAIEVLRAREYAGGDFVIEEALANGTNYKQYIASYLSEGLKIYGLLTVPIAERPENGFPSIMFIHGYIPPKQYSTTGNYPTYQARLARAGFVTYKPDLRGHGNSEGEPVSSHYSEKYVVDTLFALEYLKNYEAVDPERIGYWGHSNGGSIGLRTVLISPDIKAASFWAGVVGSYIDMFETYNAKIGFLQNASSSALVRNNDWPSQNLEFWNKLDPYAYLSEITMPIQLQHGTADDSVPIELSQSLRDELQKLGKRVEYFEYPGDDHNIGRNVSTAFARTIEFYRENL